MNLAGRPHGGRRRRPFHTPVGLVLGEKRGGERLASNYRGIYDARCSRDGDGRSSEPPELWIDAPLDHADAKAVGMAPGGADQPLIH